MGNLLDNQKGVLGASIQDDAVLVTFAVTVGVSWHCSNAAIA